ncbi:MAG: restriction endonuclease subunit S [Erysipelothrix sp.]|nr:restriction endonuclease subunit S [Erysipelothrix sp.]
MSKVEELIERLCPFGVGFSSIKEVAVVGTGSSNRDQNIEDGIYPFYVRSKKVLKSDKYLFDDEAIIIPGEGGVGDVFHYINGKYDLHQRAYRIKFISSKVITKFAYYVFIELFKEYIMMNAVSATVTSIRKPMIENFKIPIPPLEIQQEIVRILDTFTTLEAELEARKKQYEWYRRGLFGHNENLTYSTLGSISTRTYSGSTPLANSPDYYGGEIPWLRTQEVRFNRIYDTEMKITEKALKETSVKWIPENCVIIAISGATAGRSAINKIPLTTNQHCCCLEIDQKLANYRYVFHWVSSQYEKLKSLGQGARSDLNSSIIKGYPIPLVEIREQERIADILDSFDILVNDISCGLPAEITARRKQYEYYRNKLLTFKEVNHDPV